MNSKNIFRPIAYLFITLMLPFCGAEFIDDNTISGKIYMPESLPENIKNAPVFVAVLKGDDIESFRKDPGGTIAVMTRAEIDPEKGIGSYSVSLRDTGLKTGDRVTLLAFTDRNYNGSIPNPETAIYNDGETDGDITGVFIDTKNFSSAFRVGSFERSPDITLNRYFYDHSAAIKFRLERGSLEEELFTDGAEVTLFAAPEDIFTSEDMESALHKIIAMKSVKLKLDPDKNDLSVYYTLPVLPVIHKDISVLDEDNIFKIHDIYVFALLHINGSESPGLYDRIGFFGRDFMNMEELSEELQGLWDLLSEYMDIDFPADDGLYLPIPLPEPVINNTVKIEDMVQEEENSTVKFIDPDEYLQKITPND